MPGRPVPDVTLSANDEAYAVVTAALILGTAAVFLAIARLPPRDHRGRRLH